MQSTPSHLSGAHSGISHLQHSLPHDPHSGILHSGILHSGILQQSDLQQSLPHDSHFGMEHSGIEQSGILQQSDLHAAQLRAAQQPIQKVLVIYL